MAASGCRQDPERAHKAALKMGAPRSDAAAVRERQTARFAGVDEQRLLVGATQVLQDLGFTIEESVARCGARAGAKDRDAAEAVEVAARVGVTIGFALLGVRRNPTRDQDQVIRATRTTRPEGDGARLLRAHRDPQRRAQPRRGADRARIQPGLLRQDPRGSLAGVMQMTAMPLAPLRFSRPLSRSLSRGAVLPALALAALAVAACAPQSSCQASKKSAVELRTIQIRTIPVAQDEATRAVSETTHDLGYRITRVSPEAGTVAGPAARRCAWRSWSSPMARAAKAPCAPTHRRAGDLYQPG